MTECTTKQLIFSFFRKRQLTAVRHDSLIYHLSRSNVYHNMLEPIRQRASLLFSA
jgi:hypothetical protein